MRKLLLIVMLLAAALLGTIPALAQANWYAFLYNGITRQLMRVDLNGAQEVFDLGLDDTIFLGGRDISLTPDGSRVAFCANRADVETPQGETTLIVRDLAAQFNVLEVPLGGNIGCRVTGAGFSPDAARVAVGVVKYYPGSPDMDTTGPAWRLLVVDVASGGIVAEINAETPAVTNAGVLPGVALLPEVRAFANNQIIFAEVPWGIGGAPEWRAYTWQIDTGAVAFDTTERWGRSGLSVLDSTGEVAWLDHDPALPAVNPGGPIPAFNVVKLADASGAERVIHHTGEWVLVDTEFINGGAQLGILWLSTFDPENPSEQQARWMALGRDGTLGELGAGATFSQIADAPGGFALFEFLTNDDFTEQTSRLSYVSSGQARPLWEAQDPGWEFAGVVGAPPMTGLPAFP